MTAQPLPAAGLGVAYNQILTALGGTEPFAFSISSSSLPPGLTLSPTGVISGTPVSTGSFSFTVQAIDSGGCTGQRAYTLAVACPTITINPATLPPARIGGAYNQTVTASGGVAPFTFSISAGALPPGLTLSPATGLISGVPTDTGVFNFTITVADANLCTGSQGYTLLVLPACPTITVIPINPALPTGTAGQPYNLTFTASGGTPPSIFDVVAGALPPGLTLALNGVLLGTPTTSGSFSFVIRATESGGCTGQRAYTLIIACPIITINPPTLPAGTGGVAYNQTLTASGGTGPFVFSISSGSLPPGLTLSPAGVISGTPTAAGSFSFTVTATDANGFQGNRDFTILTTTPFPPSPPSPISPTPTLASGESSNTARNLAIGGLLGGLGVFVGREVLSRRCPTITLIPSSLPPGAVGQPYVQTFFASGGTSHTFALKGSPPPGLTLGSGGTISGAPAAAGTFSFLVAAIDSNNCSGERAYTLVISLSSTSGAGSQPSPATIGDQQSSAITINPEKLPAGTVGLNYVQMLTASDAARPFSFSVMDGSLPTGLALAASGLINGKPAAVGTYDFTALVTDRNGQRGLRDFAITVSESCSSLGIAPATLPNGGVGQGYSQNLKAVGGTGPFAFSLISGAMPAGLSLDHRTGSISGKPSQAATFNFTVKATDSGGCVGMISYQVKIAPKEAVGSGVADSGAFVSSPSLPTSPGGMGAPVRGGAKAKDSAPRPSRPRHKRDGKYQESRPIPAEKENATGRAPGKLRLREMSDGVQRRNPTP